MNRITVLLLAGLLLFGACKRRLSAAGLKQQLEKAMTQHLNQQDNSPHPQFDVLNVEWYEEKEYYRCEFTVKMTLPDGKDTTGIMRGKVSRDFTTVE